MALGPGSIAFIAFNADGNDGIAFIALEAIDAGQIIRFSENEWNGSAIGAGGAFIDNNEGSIAWTNGGSQIAAGTIVEIVNWSTGTVAANIGTAVRSGSVGVGVSNETLYAFVGTSNTAPTAFLTALTNAVDFNTPANGVLTNTGLTAGSNAIVLPGGSGGADVAAFNPATGGSSFASAAAARGAFNNGSNWVFQDASGNQDADSINPDAPFLTSPFSPLTGVTFNFNATPNLSINDVTIAEGDAGTKIFTFTVGLTAPAPAGGVTFDIATADGTATAGSDYVGKSLPSQTIAAGAQTYSFDVTVNGDTSFESNETFFVNITNVVGANVTDAQGAGVITNDDAAPLPTLTINDPTVSEGNAGTAVLTYTVGLSAPAPAGGVTFDIATVAGGTATAGTDYVAKSLTGQTIAAGAQTYSFSVVVNGDTTFEPNETVRVDVANVSGAIVSDGQGLGTITNDDVAPAPWINEIHYDNGGVDAGELVEIAGVAGLDLSGYKIVLYNGDPAQLKAYTTTNLSGTIGNLQGGYGALAFTYPSNGIQNGGATGTTNSPDGVALVDPGGNVIQFLSYEGTFTPTDGPAAGMASTDIGVREDGATAAGKSLQLGGSGTKYADFTWQAETDQTANAVNTNQSFGPPPPVVSIANASVAEGDAGTKLLTFTVSRNDAATAFTVNYATDDGSASAGSDYDSASGTLTFTAGGPLTQNVSVTIKGDTTVEPNETFTVNLSGLANTAGATTIKNATATGTILNDDVAITKIYEIQGSGHTSPYAGTSVTTQGVVTAIDTNGFYIQDVTGDGNAATSDGLFVFTNSAPPATAVVGALVNVSGTVQEFIPSSSDPGALPLTELSGAIAVTQLSTGNALPTAVVLSPPTESLAAGAAYYEALEGMLVSVPAPLVIGPTNGFGEIWTVANNGVGATGLNARGDLLIQGGTSSFGNINAAGGDFNPERIQIDPGLGKATPSVSTGAKLNDVTGILNYSFGNYEVLATSTVTVAQASPLVKTGAALTGDAAHLLVASYNAENLDPGDGATRFQTVGNEVVTKLNNADIIALQEVQDNNGAQGGTSSTVTSASTTLQMLVDAILAAGGPQYAYIDNPFIGANTNGGEGGGNIRTAYLYRTDRVSLVSGSLRTIGANGQSLTSTDTSQQTDTNNPFYGSRPPLAADFSFNGQTVTVVNNHFTSKGGSGVLMGSLANPPSGGEVQRAGQAQAVNSFIDGLLAANAAAKVIVTGDLNEFDFEEPISILKGTASIINYSGNGDPFNATAKYQEGGSAILNDLQDLLPADQHFDYSFDGNAQTLDHMMVTGSLLSGAQFQPVHINAEFVDQTSDHDPLIARFLFNTTPVAQPASAPASEDQTLNGQLTAFDPDGQTLTYSLVTDAQNGAVVVNADGSYKYTPAANYNGTDSFTFKVSDGIAESTAQVSLTVAAVNDAPTANAASASVAEDGVLNGQLTASDIDSPALTYSLVAGPLHGAVVVNADGTYKYTPTADYNGSDSFSFKANDGSADSNTAVVSLTINAVNDAPVANAASASLDEDQVLTGLLTASDGDTAQASLTYSLATGPLHGAVVVNGDGSYKYTPTADYNGTDSFSFKANDGNSDSNAAVVSLTIAPVNDAPVANAASASVNEDQVLTGLLTASDIDTAQAALVYSLAGGPQHGSVVVGADGAYKYTPTADYNGSDSFSFKVSDGSLSSTAQVSLTVGPVNDGPTAANDTASVLERGTVTINVLANDTDIDAGDSKSIVSVSATTKGSSVAIVDGKIAYTADGDTLALLNAGQTAVDSFTYVMKDAAGATSSATVQVTVTGVANGSTINAGNGNQTVNGTSADEIINGGNGNDSLYGLGGSDTISGGNGDDKLYGGAGIDSLDGGNGNDLLDGGDGDDTLDAGNGDDVMLGGAGVDRFFGGNGNDLMTGGAGNDTFTGGNGSDTYIFGAGFGKDVVTDFKGGEDNLQFASSLFANYAAVMSKAAQVGSAVVISYDLDNTITLQGVSLGSLKAGDFIFT